MAEILGLSAPILVFCGVVFEAGALLSLLALLYGASSGYHPRYTLFFGVGLTAQMTYVAWFVIASMGNRSNGLVIPPGPNLSWILVPLVAAGVILGVYLRHWHYWITSLLWVFHLPLVRELCGVHFWLGAQILLCIEVAVWALLVIRESRHALGPAALKMAFDEAPVGLAFLRGQGRYLAMNRTMSNYLRQLDIPPNLYISTMLEQLRSKSLSSSGSQSNPEYFEVALPSDRVVLFTCEELSGPGSRVWQLQATDVTERYQLMRELEEQNQQLAESFRQLKDLLVDIENSPDRIQAASRTRFHDILAQRLSVVHRFVEDQTASPQKISYLIKLLESLPRDLTGSATQITPEDSLDVLINSFAAVGLNIRGEMNLPDSPVTAAAAVNLLRESATNALAHTGARELLVDSREDSGYWMATFQNSNPNISVAPSGHGLEYMRKTVEDLGGEFSYQEGDPFTVLIRLPILSVSPTPED